MHFHHVVCTSVLQFLPFKSDLCSYAFCTFVSFQEKDVFKKKLHEAETEFAKGSVAGLVNCVTTA